MKIEIFSLYHIPFKFNVTSRMLHQLTYFCTFLSHSPPLSNLCFECDMLCFFYLQYFWNVLVNFYRTDCDGYLLVEKPQSIWSVHLWKLFCLCFVLPCRPNPFPDFIQQDRMDVCVKPAQLLFNILRTSWSHIISFSLSISSNVKFIRSKIAALGHVCFCLFDYQLCLRDWGPASHNVYYPIIEITQKKLLTNSYYIRSKDIGFSFLKLVYLNIFWIDFISHGVKKS